MPWLPLYADKHDIDNLFEWLNAEESIAFIISDGPKRWIAVQTLEAPCSGRVCLWHAESGPLPLLRKLLPDGRIRNPWKGWTEKRTGADSSSPYFGPGHPGVYWLNVNTTSKDAEDGIGLTSFEWIGNHYKCIGNAAPIVTKKWWERLRRHVKKTATRIPRWGPIDGDGAEIWTLPSAFNSIENGCSRDANPI